MRRIVLGVVVMAIRCIWAGVLLSILLVPAISSCTKPAEFVLSKVVTSRTVVAPFEAIIILAEITNIGGMSDNYDVVLKIDGIERDKQTVQIKPSENKTISFTISEPNAGEHEIDINTVKRRFTVYDPHRFDSFNTRVTLENKPASSGETMEDLNKKVIWKVEQYWYWYTPGIGSGPCRQTGSIKNSHDKLSMTDVSINNTPVTSEIKPGETYFYNSLDIACPDLMNQQSGSNAQIKWQWKESK